LKEIAMAENWIAGAVGPGRGGLHRSLGVPQGEKIPVKKIAKAVHSDDPRIVKQARLAQTLSKLHRRHGGQV
jgi:hypothetical protein